MRPSRRRDGELDGPARAGGQGPQLMAIPTRRRRSSCPTTRASARGAGSTTPATARRAGARPSGRSSRSRRSCTTPPGPSSAAKRSASSTTTSRASTTASRSASGSSCTGRVARRGRPAHRGLAARAVAGERRRPLSARGRRASGSARPELLGRGTCLTDADGRYRFVTIKPGAYPWGNHENAWRPAHLHFSVFGRLFTQRLVTQMYFPGDPLFAYDPIFNAVRDPTGARPARGAVRSRDDAARMGARLSVGHRPRPRRLRHDAAGARAMMRTPSQTVGPYYAIGLCRRPRTSSRRPATRARCGWSAGCSTARESRSATA